MTTKQRLTPTQRSAKAKRALLNAGGIRKTINLLPADVQHLDVVKAQTGAQDDTAAMREALRLVAKRRRRKHT